MEEFSAFSVDLLGPVGAASVDRMGALLVDLICGGRAEYFGE